MDRGRGRARGAWIVCVGMLTFACAWPIGEARGTPPALAIESVSVIDVEGGTDRGVVVHRRDDQRVVVEGDRIVAVGPMSGAGATLTPSGARIIDGRGRFLIPGLWDAHVHFLYDETLTEAMPGLFLDWGVTSVRDTGGDLAQLVALRKRWQASAAPAPRIFVSGPLLDGRRVVYDGASASQPPLGIAVPDVKAAERRVEALAAGGADFIKIYEMVDPPVFDALVRAARERNLPIAAHVPLSLTADVAGPRVDSMEHLRNVELACARSWPRLLAERRAALESDPGARGHPLRSRLHEAQRLPAIANHDAARCEVVLAALRGTLQVPTLRLNAFDRVRPDRMPAWRAAADALPDDVRAIWDAEIRTLLAPDEAPDLRFADWSLDLVGRMRAAGVPIAAGTDTPIKLAIPGESLHRELELLVEAGLEPAEALAAAIRAPARFFGLEDELGRIAPGFAADLVLLEADPTREIANTRRIVGVASRGRWVVPRR